MNKPLTTEEMRELAQARKLLENRSFGIKLSNLLGIPIDAGFALLPKNWSGTINRAAHAALFKALEVAVVTTGKKTRKKPANRWHKLLAGASGGVGGAFGLAALAVELPVSTTIMLRSIADVAQSEGHDVREWGIKLACVEVFAFGGGKGNPDAEVSPYWATRLALNESVREAATHLARKGVVERSAPALVKLVSNIGARFGVVISEEVAAKALPIIGAVGGGVINVIFMSHFQQMARGHFIILRLEKIYGTDIVKSHYDAIEI